MWAQLLINVLLWPCIHVIVSLWAFRRRLAAFNPESFLYRERAWEQDGHFYQKVFCIKSWKNSLPEGSKILGFGFNKSQLHRTDSAYLQRYYLETCRGEWAHLMTIGAVVFFFIWNPWWAKLVMLAYALAVNLPCILVQRYNRLVLKRILLRKKAGKIIDSV